MIKYFLLIISALCFSSNVFSQKEIRPSRLKELAESAELESDLYSAIDYYELLYHKKPKQSIQNKLGILYLNVRDYERAKGIYLQIINSGKKQDEAYLNLGISYKHLGVYDSCIYYLSQCKKKKLNDAKSYQLKMEYKGAQTALITPKDTTTISINPNRLSLNTPHMESAPYFVNDSLIIYASQNINKSNSYEYFDTVNLPTTRLHYAKKQNNNWYQANEISAINHNFLNVGNAYYSLDKKLFYFTNTIKSWDKKNISQLYVCEIEKGQFGAPLKLNNKINDPFYSSTQPSVGNTFNLDLEVIYFSSNRPGGKGGMDIWYVIYNKKRARFGAPINAGRRINTPLDEITPYYDPSTKTLYYSSNGLAGFGGYDVYKSVGELKSWTKTSNTGSYINSNADEIYFRLNPSRDAGFIVSNKPSDETLNNTYCCFDLSYFTYNNPDQLSVKGSLLTKTNPVIEKLLKSGIEFRDTNITLNKYLNDAVVSLYLKTEMGTDSLYITSDTTDSKGYFEFNAGNEQEYTLVIEEKNEIKATVDVSTMDNEVREIILDIKPIESLPEVPLVIKNIYYEFGSSDLGNEAEKILDETLILLLKEMPSIKVEISSHTDNIGDSVYNYKLSKIRAENVAQYLFRNSISKNNVVTIGMGESDPIAPNQYKNGEDNPLGRERNRRTEFKIIGNSESVIDF